MAKVMDEILESFYAKLSDSDVVDEPTVKELRALFDSDKKLKGDDFVAVLEKGATEETP